MKVFRSRSLFLFLAFLVLPFVSRAQDTGYIGGTIVDKTGAAIAGAEVTIKNLAGSLTRTTVSNGDGAYVIPGLPGDSYDLSVTAKGFQKFTAKKIVLNVAEKARIDVTMSVGAITEEVVVTGESIAQVETTSSDITNTINGKQISELELNGRNFTQLVTLSAGVVNQTGTDDGKVGVYGNVAYSINGGRTEYNNWELDGGDNMDNGSNSTLNVYPNPEAISEFKVLTSNYGAQYGRNGSGTIEVETKSGTSSFHGSAFEYLRNEFFKAKSWAEGADPTAKKAPYKKHDFGYTIGGPVYIPNHYNSDKKKTFFFFSEEWRRENDSTTINQNVPSDAERGGNFSDLCPGADCPHQVGSAALFPGNTITPTSVGSALLAIIPQANTTTNGFPAVLETVASPTKWREELVRVDHNINDKNRLTFRYIHDSWQTVVPNALWGNGTSFQNITTNFVGPGTSFVARLNSNISPTLLNEFVASYTGDHIFLTTGGPVGLPAGFSMGSIFANGFGGKLPAISVGSNNAYGGTFTSDTGYFPWKNANPTYTYRDNMTKILGNHTMQFGAYVAFAQKNEANSPYIQGILTFDSSAATVTTGNAFADLLLGNIASYQQTTKQTQYYNRFKNVEPYFQDDWRVTKRLTLNLGLRISAFGTYRERYQQAFNFNPDAFVAANAPGFNSDGSLNTGVSGNGNPLNGFVQCGGKGGVLPLVPGSAFPTASVGSSSNPGCLSDHRFNPAPRIGFAFDPKGDGKMAIRGGYGIFYEHTNGNEGNTESLEGSAPLVLTATQSNVASGVGSCPGSSSGYDCIGAGGGTIPFFPLTVLSIPNKAVWPYVQQWNFGVQKELPSHIILSAAYVGSKGTHLTLLSNGNQLLPVSSNPYTAGEPIIAAQNFAVGGPAINTVCPDSNLAGGSVNGTPVSGQVAVNLAVACGTVVSNASVRTNFPGYNNINTLRDAANSIYHSLQLTANRNVGNLTLSVSYTYSHSIDDSSDRGDAAFVNAYDFAANRASSNFDLRHNLALSYVYSLPFFKGSGLSHALLGGWQVSGITVAQSGTPFSVTNGLSSFGDNAGVANGVGTGSRPDLAGNPRSGFTSTQDPGQRGPLAYNPAAFAAPTGLTFGNVGRNTLDLPGRLNFDFGIFKKFPITERTGFDFRWENYNLFNHTQYNGINSSFGPSDFLHLNATHDPRRMQFGLRFYF
ncbi:MAG: carboxypeptidase regulatory-like domain-containing protein [Acidobacteria bacterium]|nr:carboxypeptidase regulatory-like domain-containing protein [Acidobacteriota bacterium]MBS1865702.1 carboxypeptidase regulatory-like domain-containing protein [Acidobacteriota bacterium]